ncbi:hypothetical protein LC55x_2113 [Lysobacter capsici]|nr:hypothetical protein LC55x_2113 [Lysobacter capsici]
MCRGGRARRQARGLEPSRHRPAQGADATGPGRSSPTA